VSPAVSALEQAGSAPFDVYRMFTKEQIDKAGIRDVLTALGLLTGLPLQPLGRPLGYAADVSQGKAKPANDADAVRGAIVGR
jgi:hypothetical protein